VFAVAVAVAVAVACAVGAGIFTLTGRAAGDVAGRRCL